MVQLGLELERVKKAAPGHGGRRPGAGRPKGAKSKTRRDPLHRTRPIVKRYQPQHIVLRTRADVPRLRKGPIYRAIRKSISRMLGDAAFNVVHVSIQHNHLHFLVEAGTKSALRRGMQALAISAAKQINKVCKRKGKVFAYRYHATAIRTPKQARHALAYVLNNWRRHNEDERTLAARFAAIDPYSSAPSFEGWKESSHRIAPLPGFKFFQPIEVSPPRTWLLSIGWQRHGAISAYESPGLIK